MGVKRWRKKALAPAPELLAPAMRSNTNRGHLSAAVRNPARHGRKRLSTSAVATGLSHAADPYSSGATTITSEAGLRASAEEETAESRRVNELNAMNSTYRDKVQLFMKPPEERSVREVDTLVDFTKGMVYMQQLKNGAQRRSICRMLSYEKREQDAVLMEEGDVGDFMYLLLSGSVVVFTRRKTNAKVVRRESQDANVVLTAKQLAKLDREREPNIVRLGEIMSGNHFGELALVNPDSIRTASIQCREPCELLKLSRADFDATLRVANEEDLVHKALLMQKMPLFAKTSVGELLPQSYVAHIVKYPKGALIQRQGDLSTHLTVVLKGMVNASAVVSCQVQHDHPLFARIAQNMRSNDGRMRVKCNLGNYGEDTILGEESVASRSIAKMPVRVTFTAAVDTVVMQFDAFDFSRRINEHCKAILMEHQRLSVSLTDVSRCATAQLKWLRYRGEQLGEKLGETILDELEHRRQTNGGTRELFKPRVPPTLDASGAIVFGDPPPTPRSSRPDCAAGAAAGSRRRTPQQQGRSVARLSTPVRRHRAALEQIVTPRQRAVGLAPDPPGQRAGTREQRSTSQSLGSPQGGGGGGGGGVRRTRARQMTPRSAPQPPSSRGESTVQWRAETTGSMRMRSVKTDVDATLARARAEVSETEALYASFKERLDTQISAQRTEQEKRDARDKVLLRGLSASERSDVKLERHMADPKHWDHATRAAAASLEADHAKHQLQKARQKGLKPSAVSPASLSRLARTGTAIMQRYDAEAAQAGDDPMLPAKHHAGRTKTSEKNHPAHLDRSTERESWAKSHSSTAAPSGGGGAQGGARSKTVSFGPGAGAGAGPGQMTPSRSFSSLTREISSPLESSKQDRAAARAAAAAQDAGVGDGSDSDDDEEWLEIDCSQRISVNDGVYTMMLPNFTLLQCVLRSDDPNAVLRSPGGQLNPSFKFMLFAQSLFDAFARYRNANSFLVRDSRNSFLLISSSAADMGDMALQILDDVRHSNAARVVEMRRKEARANLGVKARELAGTVTAADKMRTEGMHDEFSRMNEGVYSFEVRAHVAICTDVIVAHAFGKSKPHLFNVR